VRNAIAVGYDGSEGSADALALGTALAQATSHGLALVYVRPLRLPEMTADADARERKLTERAEAVLAGAPAADVVVRAVVCDVAVASGLQQFAAAEGAATIVVGSPQYTDHGHIDTGAVAAALLHGAPCAVALAPRGYAAQPRAPFRRILVAYTTSEEARAALRAAAELGRACGATVRVVSVIGAVPSWTSEVSGYADAVRATVQEELDRSLRVLASTVECEGIVLAGDPVGLLLEQSRDWADLVIAGSRGYGHARRVLLGSVSTGLLSGAHVPVLVTPRGALTELVATPPVAMAVS